MRNMEAETVASIIVEEVIARFGVPQVIHSDQGKQYKSRHHQNENYGLSSALGRPLSIW
jgi:transposase InsO family protein